MEPTTLIQAQQVDEHDVYMFTVPSGSLGFRQVGVAPPIVPEGMCARWDTLLNPMQDLAWGTDGAWVLEDDHRKDKLYQTADGSDYTLASETDYGTYEGTGVLPAWLTTLERPSQFHNWTDGAWLLDVSAELADLKAKKISELSRDCQAHIYEGFGSEALGDVYHYPALDKDQQNLTASVLDSTVPGLPEGWVTPFWCERDGIWDFVPHSAEQIQQVDRDAKIVILTALAKNKVLADQVAIAADKTEVAAIAWASPA